MASDIVTITDVIEELIALIADYEPNWDGPSKQILSEALEEGTKDLPGHLRNHPEYGEQSAWHLEQKAFLFLRLEIENQQLSIYQRASDSDLDQVVDPKAWMTVPHTFLPIRLLNDHSSIYTADAMLFYKTLRYAFIYRRQFELWISSRLISAPDSARQRNAIKRAVQFLWDGVPPSSATMNAKNRDRHIIKWVSDNGYRQSRSDTFSPATIRRALHEILAERLARKKR